MTRILNASNITSADSKFSPRSPPLWEGETSVKIMVELLELLQVVVLATQEIKQGRFSPSHGAGLDGKASIDNIREALGMISSNL
jgi:hypothetical protein